MNNTQVKVFISHNSSDKDKINVLADSLESLGCEVFYSSDASKNTIEYGTDFYETIKNEINNSDVVLFMVSENFYNSIPSLIEVGIAYGLNKRMIPIGFKTGNYQTDLRGLFNTNLRLAALDNEEDIISILEISRSTNVGKIFKCKNNILSVIGSSKEISDTEIEDMVKSTFNDDLSITLEEDFKSNDIIDDIVAKFVNLNDADYIFIDYIVRSRTYRFSLTNDWNWWWNKFDRWCKRRYIDIELDDIGFLSLLDILGLNDSDSDDEYKLSFDVVKALEFIHNRDKSVIIDIIDRYSLPF